ncbi:MAG: DUF2202 domain-containing protein [Proteobacteria bacterium]|nr:DUF2202 domain-containing protein [Pseudomonadota bacterium]
MPRYQIATTRVPSSQGGSTMNRRRTITIAGTVGAVAGFMGVVYGTANWATSQREGPGSPAGPNPAQALRAGRAPIPEVAVAPGTGSGPAPVVPPFPKFTGAPEEDETGATTTVRSGDVQAILDRMPLAPSLPAAERDGLIWMREEERLAHDVYVALARRWGNGPFSNIGAAEATHSEAVRLLIDRYGVADPASGTVVGNYGNPIFSTAVNASTRVNPLYNVINSTQSIGESSVRGARTWVAQPLTGVRAAD